MFFNCVCAGEACLPGGGGDAADGQVHRYWPPVHGRGQDPRGGRGESVSHIVNKGCIPDSDIAGYPVYSVTT